MVRKDANEKIIMDNKVLELLELNLKALKKVNPLLYCQKKPGTKK
jgi:hypothetical protein